MAEKKKLSKGHLVLMACILGPLDTGGAWLLHAKGWFLFDLIFYPVIFLIILCSKDSN
jgi:hypothetical protein